MGSGNGSRVVEPTFKFSESKKYIDVCVELPDVDERTISIELLGGKRLFVEAFGKNVVYRGGLELPSKVEGIVWSTYDGKVLRIRLRKKRKHKKGKKPPFVRIAFVNDLIEKCSRLTREQERGFSATVLVELVFEEALSEVERYFPVLISRDEARRIGDAIDRLLMNLERAFFTPVTLREMAMSARELYEKGKPLSEIVERVVSELLDHGLTESEARELVRSFVRDSGLEMAVRETLVDHFTTVVFKEGTALTVQLGAYTEDGEMELHKRYIEIMERYGTPVLTYTVEEYDDYRLIPEEILRLHNVVTIEKELPDPGDFILVLNEGLPEMMLGNDVSAMTYLAHLLLYRDKERAYREARSFLEKASRYSSWYTVARYGRRIVPLIAVRFGWGELGDDWDDEDIESLESVYRVLTRIKMPKRILQKFEDLSMSRDELVKGEVFLFNTEVGGKIYVSQLLMEPQPLPRELDRKLRMLTEIALRHPDFLDGYLRGVSKKIVKDINAAIGNANTLEEVLDTALTKIINVYEEYASSLADTLP